MNQLFARLPHTDFSHGFSRRWNGGDAAATHVFNALSWMFPQGERFFIDVAREVSATLALPPDSALAGEIKTFVAQEAIHTHQHLKYNAVLGAQGFSDVVSPMIAHLMRRTQTVAPLSRLAVVCAYEHFTAALGDFLLRHPQVLAKAPPSLALIWGWHAAEESEHKAVCFDLYRAAGGGYLRRIMLYLLVTMSFSGMFGRQFGTMLREDGALAYGQRWQTCRSIARVFFGRDGISWSLLRHGLAYFRPDFHPWQCDNRQQVQAWLQQHAAQLRVVSHNE